MNNIKRKYKKVALPLIICIILISMLLSTVISALTLATAPSNMSSSYINLFKDDVIFDKEQYFNSSSVYQLSSEIDDDEEISIILQTKSPSVLDAYDKCSTNLTLAE